MIQRTEEWYLARKGKITASECYLLLANHKEAMTEEELAEYKAANPKSRVTTKEMPFSEATFTYLKGKVAERYMEDDKFLYDMDAKQVNSRAIAHGVEHEPFARALYEQRTGKIVNEVGFIALKGFEGVAGGSPDGVTHDDKGIIEIKCPWCSEKHQDYFLFETAEDLKEYNLQYYAQIQFNILVTGAEWGDFVSYDPRMYENYDLKVLRVPKDREMCETLLERVKMAKEWMLERMDAISEAQNRQDNEHPATP